MRRMPSTDDREDHHSGVPLVRVCARLADSTAFNVAIFAVIVANAIVLGAQTYTSAAALDTLDSIFLAVFVGELAIRLLAHGSAPLRFFRSGWNVFDAAVVIAAFLPGLRENATLLRLVRLARIVRVVRLLPDLRVLVAAVARSIPGVLSLAVMTLLLVYLYGMIGWILYGDELEGFADIGEAMLTMFVVLSLENLPTYIEEGRAVSAWTIPFYISYVLIASFLVFNFFIGVIVNSMERAREIVSEREAAELAERGIAVPEADPARRIAALRELLDELERDLASQRPDAREREPA
jgi:voltage-gated sodium channel